MKPKRKAHSNQINATSATPSESNMRPQLQILLDPRFRLVHNVTQRFSDGPEGDMCEEIRLTRTGLTLDPAIKKKAAVSEGTLVATDPSPDIGNLFSPVHGDITDITERYVMIAPRPALPTDPEVHAPDLEGLDGDELVQALKHWGVDTRQLSRACDTLIINALNPEPGITWAEPMLASHVRNLEAGLALHQRISRAKRIIVALPKGMQASYPGMEIAYIDPVYPNSLDQLVRAKIMGSENPTSTEVVGIHTLWGLGRIVITGKPLMETVLTVNSKHHTGNYRIKDGTRVCDLLRIANVQVNPGDTVVVGGPLQGQSIAQLTRGLSKNSTGLFVVEADSIPQLDGDVACVNCGACTMVCPARLAPDLLSRYAEFARYDRCRAEHIEACMECGLCGYVCLARRPVLQYIRLAKEKLAAEKTLVPIEPLSK